MLCLRGSILTADHLGYTALPAHWCLQWAERPWQLVFMSLAAASCETESVNNHFHQSQACIKQTGRLERLSGVAMAEKPQKLTPKTWNRSYAMWAGRLLTGQINTGLEHLIAWSTDGQERRKIKALKTNERMRRVALNITLERCLKKWSFLGVQYCWKGRDV